MPGHKIAVTSKGHGLSERAVFGEAGNTPADQLLITRARVGLRKVLRGEPSNYSILGCGII
jgi:hypothetical protein